MDWPEIKQRDQLTHADLAGVLAKNVHELEAHGVAKSLCDRSHALGALALHVGVDDGLAAGSPAGRFVFGASSRSTAIDLRISI